jgi:hypothetical protein
MHDTDVLPAGYSILFFSKMLHIRSTIIAYIFWKPKRKMLNFAMEVSTGPANEVLDSYKSVHPLIVSFQSIPQMF